MSPEAKADLKARVNYYESQSPGLGRHFRESLITDIEMLKTLAGIHAHDYGYQRLIGRTFPFIVCYELKGTTALIVAAMDGRSDREAAPKLVVLRNRKGFSDVNE